jgi:hypothetical protein
MLHRVREIQLTVGRVRIHPTVQGAMHQEGDHIWTSHSIDYQARMEYMRHEDTYLMYEVTMQFIGILRSDQQTKQVRNAVPTHAIGFML